MFHIRTNAVANMGYSTGLTDKQRNMLAISVHAANVHDTKSGKNPAKKLTRSTRQSKDFAAMTAVVANHFLTR